MAFYEVINAVTFFAVLIVDHRIAEAVYVAGSFPGGRVHENGGVDAYDVLVHLGHAFPPIVAYILFQLGAVLAIVVYGTQAIVYFTGWENESVFFTMRYNRLEFILICCHSGAKIIVM